MWLRELISIKVKALITWIKAAGMALFKNPPSFQSYVWKKRRFQSLLGREQFYVVYKNHYSLHRWQNCKMIWLKGGDGASFNNNSSQFISTKLPFSSATKKISLVALLRGNFQLLPIIFMHSDFLSCSWLLLLASSCLWLLVKLVLHPVGLSKGYESFHSKIIFFFLGKYETNFSFGISSMESG